MKKKRTVTVLMMREVTRLKGILCSRTIRIRARKIIL